MFPHLLSLAWGRIGAKTIAKWHSLHMEKPGTTGSGRSTASYKLQQAAHGEIRLQVTRQYAPEGPLRTLSGGADDEVMPTVTVTVVEARDLVAADRGGTSDPFVHIHYPTLKKPLKTAVVSKTLCPVWNEVHVINLKGSKPGASPDLSSESLLRGETDSMESRELPGWSSAPSSGHSTSLSHIHGWYQARIIPPLSHTFNARAVTHLWMMSDGDFPNLRCV